MTPARSVLVLVVVVSVAAAGCQRSSGAGPGATVPLESTTTAAPAIDVARIPDPITVAYADAVMDALDRVLGDAIRELVRAQGPTPAFRDRLDAIYDEPEFSDQESAFGSLAAKDLDKFRAEPPDPSTTVERIVEAGPSCVVLRVNRDFGPIFREPSDASTKGFIALVPKKSDSDPAALNPTAWSMVFDAGTSSGDAPSDPC